MKDVLALIVALTSLLFLNKAIDSTGNINFYVLCSLSIVLNVYALILLFTKEK